MSTEENGAARAAASEQTPLLRDANPACPRPDEAQEPVPETSTKELIAILSSIWLGVFLAALGMFHKYLRLSDPHVYVDETDSLCSRYNNRRDAFCSHLILV